MNGIKNGVTGVKKPYLWELPTLKYRKKKSLKNPKAPASSKSLTDSIGANLIARVKELTENGRKVGNLGGISLYLVGAVVWGVSKI